MTGSLVTVRPANRAGMRGLDDLTVHARRHKGVLLIAHILVVPDSIRIAFFRKQDFLHLDGQARIGFRHITHPLRVKRHTHQHILVPAYRVHRFKNIDARPAEKAVVFGRLLFCQAIPFKIDPPAVGPSNAA